MVDTNSADDKGWIEAAKELLCATNVRDASVRRRKMPIHVAIGHQPVFEAFEITFHPGCFDDRFDFFLGKRPAS